MPCWCGSACIALGRDRAGRKRVRGNGGWCRWGICCLIKRRGVAGRRLRLGAGDEIVQHFSESVLV